MTIGDVHAYHVLTGSTCRLLLGQASAAPLTLSSHLALFMDGNLDAGTFEHMSSVRRWRRRPV